MTTKLQCSFVNAMHDVFKLMLDLDITSQDEYGKDSELIQNQKVYVSIGIVGDVQGEVLFEFSNETSIEIVNIMSGMDIQNIDDFVTSALGEIANIISGNALSALYEQGITCDILPPKLKIEMRNNDLAVDSIKEKSRSQIKTTIGLIYLEVRMFS